MKLNRYSLYLQTVRVKITRWAKGVIILLALTRRKGESIIISENIEVVVIGIVGEQVRLGVIAPKSISVHRKEIFEQIQKENKLASESADKFGTIDLSGVKNLIKKQ